MAKRKPLRVDHGPIDEDIVDSLTDEEKEWLRNWNRGDEIPGESDDDAADDAADDGDEDDSDYDEYTVAELKDMLNDRGLPTGGSKPDLVARLEEDDASDD